MLSRREFLGYGLGMGVLGVLATMNEIEKSSRRFKKEGEGYSIEAKTGGILIEVNLANKHRLIQIMNSMYFKGPHATFVREKDDKLEVFIALLEGFKKLVIQSAHDEEVISASHLSIFRKSMLGFYYVGDTRISHEIYRRYMSIYVDLGVIPASKILIAAPKDIEGRRYHAEVAHIWSGVSMEGYVMYRDNNTDPQVIRDRIDKLMKEYSEKSSKK